MESDNSLGVPTLPVEYLGFTDQLHDTAGSAASSLSSQRVSGQDLELPFYSFAIHVKQTKTFLQNRRYCGLEPYTSGHRSSKRLFSWPIM